MALPTKLSSHLCFTLGSEMVVVASSLVIHALNKKYKGTDSRISLELVIILHARKLLVRFDILHAQC